jgi:6-carboxyhexanoate--CoA ligase
MDYTGNKETEKNHRKEALCLASKVAGCPFIVAELCMSDDPDYTTGYFASRERGYIRLTAIKEKGDPRGGRIFLFDGSQEDVLSCMRYLEETPVLVVMD